MLGSSSPGVLLNASSYPFLLAKVSATAADVTVLMVKTCRSCKRPVDPDRDWIERFLIEGAPAPPESRATKADLRQAVAERDHLLQQLHGMALRMLAKELSIASSPSLSDDRSPSQIQADMQRWIRDHELVR
ncbi:hypothetical protein [Rhodopirellula halodulae]|uniref:hypothetical protein n=1 Tax=Rhodopirellula halodulae TaxID=2894198 RepID=UPI001E58B40F|nr:hypothetical protein [Rhodopirellula sp. JC737]MCC9658010.1 hypothetical protein [Rhodopirellula sp. JC737]